MNFNPIRGALAFAAIALAAGEIDAQCRASQDQILLDPAGDFGDAFGHAVAISNDLIAVGAWTDDPLGFSSGSASIFRRQGTSWAFETTLTPTNGAPGDHFGCAIAAEDASISASGQDTVVVGAWGADAIYVFRHDGTSWIEDAIFTRAAAPPPALVPGALTRFGWSLALSGDLIAVSAHLELNPVSFMRGRAFLYRHDGTQWNYEDDVRRSGTGSAVARAIATNGEQVFVSTNDSTRVGVFERVNQDWVEVAPVQAIFGSFAHGIGESLDADGDVVIVGAEFDIAAAQNSGKARVHRRSGTDWIQEEQLIGYDTGRFDRLAYDVAIDGDTALVLAVGNLTPAEAYVFRHDGSSWNQDLQLIGSGIPEPEYLGGSVAIHGGTAVVGVPSYGVPEPNGQHCCGPGAVFVFEVGTTPQTTNCPQPFCSGDRDGAGGCTTCPCSNEDHHGTHGGCNNSRGLGARLLCLGSMSVAGADLRFEVEEASQNTFGVLVSSNVALPANPAHPCFGLDTGIHTPMAPLDGIRCLGGTQIRHGPRGSNVHGSIGVDNPGWGGDDNPAGGLIQQGNFVAGQTRYWQVFYRDLAESVCMTGNNTTNAVRTLLEP